MPVFRVEFSYIRTVVTHLQADSPEDIHDFLADNPDWDIVEDAPEIIDDDDTECGDDVADALGGDYSVTEAEGITANYGIHEGQLVEVES